MEACLEARNATECLLQVIADRFAEHNKFDVPAIAVTSIIGIIALFFTGLTIVQGVLAAGPGRRKCFENVIGPWSKLTRRCWNWSEFRQESLAKTPVITTDIAGLQKMRFASLPVASAGIDENISRKYFPATWFRLLKGLRLDELLYEYSKGDYDTTSYLADYLPSDVQAVPARMDINTIVVLAAAAGCHRMDLDKETGYLNITGSNSQIRFRRDLHFDQLLGILIRQGSGYFAFGRGHASLSVIGGRDIILHRDQSQDPTGSHFALDTVTYFASFSNFSWLLWGQPNEISCVFPAVATNLTFILEVMAAQGSFWSMIRPPYPSSMMEWIKANHVDSNGIKELWEIMEFYQGPQRETQLFRLCVAFISNPVNRIGELGEKSRCYRTRLSLKTAALLKVIAKKPQMGEGVSESDTLPRPKVPGSFLLDSTDGFHATRWVMSALREIKHVHRSSRWGPSLSVICAPSESAFKFMLGVREPADIGGVRLEAQKGDQGLVAHSLLDALCSPLVLHGHKDKEIENSIEWLSGLGDNYQELLIYRALLLGMMCSMALDHSVVVEADVGSHIVHFL
ncbi:hypothetical protein BDR22DRAFT_959947 [Usnea florida]